MTLSMSLIQEASRFLEGKLRKTPVEYAPFLSKKLGRPVYFKLESLQLTGSFKVRGALFYLSKLSEEEKQKGVGACTAGNHGIALSYAAKQLNIPCTIFAPRSLDHAKHQKILSFGATVLLSDFDGYDATHAWAYKQGEKRGLHMVPAYDHPFIMAANGGSLALETMEQLPDAKNFLLPMGGGGMLAGFAYAMQNKGETLAAQHVDSPALALSLQRGKAVTELPPIQTVAGAIEGGLGEKCFQVIQKHVKNVILCSEEEIKGAFCWMLEMHQYLIEPTSAVTLAAALYHSLPLQEGPLVLVLSGRNVSLKTIANIVIH